MAKTRDEIEPTEAVRLSRIKVHYKDQTQAILDIDHIAVFQGEQIALIGPSGSGKTTLLRVINGYVRPTSGNYSILGNEMTIRTARRQKVRRRVSFVFQNFNLIERASVFENVLWGRLGYTRTISSLIRGFGKADKRLAMEAIREVDLLDQIDQRCDTLSGGQQQRVGIARALAQEPEIILADEPISSLDPALADDILNLLHRVSKARSSTLLMSLHQPELARRYADRIIGLREGHVIFDDAASELGEKAIKNIYGRDIDTIRETL